MYLCAMVPNINIDMVVRVQRHICVMVFHVTTFTTHEAKSTHHTQPHSLKKRFEQLVQPILNLQISCLLDIRMHFLLRPHAVSFAVSEQLFAAQREISKLRKPNPSQNSVLQS